MPHEIWNSHGIGTNKLLKNGAILVTETEDILQEFKCLKKLTKKFKDVEKINLDSLHVDYDIFDSSKKISNSIKSTEFTNHINTKNASLKTNAPRNSELNSQSYFNSQIASGFYSMNNSNFSNISEKKKLKNSKLAYIYDLISNEPISINELCKKTSKPISQISNDLFLLELDGYIKKVAGGYICILNK